MTSTFQVTLTLTELEAILTASYCAMITDYLYLQIHHGRLLTVVYNTIMELFQ